MDESAVAMPARNQALLNATLVASTAATVDLDSLYVNSVVHSIRAEGMGGAARGKLWESLHRALLGIRTSKAALQAVASAGGAALGGDVLKEETRELFHSLRDECANFGTWDNRASAAGGGEVPALSPRSALMSATSLPAIVPSPVHDNSSSNLIQTIEIVLTVRNYTSTLIACMSTKFKATVILLMMRSPI